jgi:hypothetical protein
MNCSLAFWMLIKKREDNLDEQQAIFTHELQSALRLAAGFLNIYCEL